MGWTSYHAAYYKNGTVDRKAECDAYFMEGLNRGHYEILKSTMVGSTYYAAVKDLVKVSDFVEGKRIYETIDDGEVWAAIFLTSVNMRDYYNFSYKDMDETVGPCSYDCPESILKLLDPTDSDWANEWRCACREKRRFKNKLKSLPSGTKIIFKTKYNMTEEIKAGDEIILEKVVGYKKGRERFYWFDGRYRWKESLIPEDYEIGEKPGNKNCS
jgi:hypothetical protein